jgi:hypothetical protein
MVQCSKPQHWYRTCCFPTKECLRLYQDAMVYTHYPRQLLPFNRYCNNNRNNRSTYDEYDHSKTYTRYNPYFKEIDKL